MESVTEKKDLVHARVLDVTEKAPERIDAQCPYFTRCGGCQYQEAGYEFQLRQKQAILREVLRRTGKIELEAEIAVVAGEPWEYRNRVQLHCDQQTLGFHEAGSHKVVGVERCPVSSPGLNAALAALQAMTRDRRWPRFLRSLELFTNEKKTLINVLDSGTRHLSRTFFDWCAEKIPGALETALEYPAAGETFRVSHRSFFQVNRFLVDRLVETALAGAAGGESLDLYAGVGLFSIPLARRGGAVTAVETSASAVADLEQNAQRAGVAIRAVQLQSEQYLDTAPRRPDFVLADPPRTGLGKRVVERLAAWKTPRIHVVSCEPSTLARDLAALFAAGYRLESLTLVDLFPQTAHIESVAKLVYSAA